MRLTAAACALMLLLARPQESSTPAGAEPLQVLSAEKAWAGAEVLWPMARSGDAGTSPAAIRAIGRLEDPRQVPSLFALGSRSRRIVADAVAQSLKGFDPSVDSDLIAKSWGTLYQGGMQPVGTRDQLDAAAAVVGAIGRIAYSTPEQVHGAEEVLRRIATRTASETDLVTYRHDVMRSFESLARSNSKVTGFDDDSNELLAAVVRHAFTNDDATSRLYALGALMAGGGLDADAEQAALKDDYWQVRRLATAALGGSGGGLDESARADALVARLSDRNAQVRYEAVRAYLRRGVQSGGCGPLVNALSDDDLDVVLAALDGLGDACKDDEDITTRLTAEARVPPSTLNWHREAHAFVALAKRSPDRAAISMEGFSTYPEPWVRVYAVRAAAAAVDLARLEKLAYDGNDNVREAALETLRRLKSPNAQPAFVAGLDRGYQVVRVAAIQLKAYPHDRRLFTPLMNSLQRVTRDRSDTSRDARMALLDAIAVHAEGDDATELLPVLRDFDPKIAERAAQVVIALSGKVALPEPAPVTRGWPQAFTDLRRCVSVSLASGGRFRMRMTPEVAPIAVDRFLKLASDHYYDGLSIHRVVPNFVIQGGSPGANEYVGHKEYMRDEVGGLNTFGTVGLSTRGRNTGDAQFFVNLVDNPRLDYDYTIFAVVPERDMEVVNKIQEGEVMRSITLVPKGSSGSGCS